MQLDGALFERLASAMAADAAAAQQDSSSDPRRHERRVRVRARATVIPLTDSLASAPFEIELRDLSAGGIGFLHNNRIRLDEQFVVLLPGGSESVAILCQVSHYQPLADHLFNVGAEFIRVLRQPAENEALKLPVARPAPASRRAAS